MRSLARLARAWALHAARPFSTAGFAGIQGLSQPGEWSRLAAQAQDQCSALVDEAVRSPPSASTVRLLDDVSDQLCQVLDAAEFCRQVHSDPAWRQAAHQVCTSLGDYVHELNTHASLYSALDAAVAALERGAGTAAAAAALPGSRGGAGAAPGGASTSGRTHASARAGGAGLGEAEEALLVGKLLLRDFQRYGVHLSGAARERVAELVGAGQALGSEVTRSVADPQRQGTLTLGRREAGAVALLPAALARRFRPAPPDPRTGSVSGLAAPAESELLHSVLRLSGDEELRRRAYFALHQQPAENVGLLCALAEARAELAAAMGFPSYAHYQLDSFSLAGGPEAVQCFLLDLADATSASAAEEAASLAALKRRLGAGSGPLRPWDRAFLLAAAKAEAEGADGADCAGLARDHFGLGPCMAGLGELLHRLMGIRLQEATLREGEGWAPGVRKYEAVHEEEGPLGTVYLDPYRRAHKFPGAAHFTLRCGRRMPGGGQQAPVVALALGLAPGGGMVLADVETLLHEAGHALHSLLSRTHYQHLSGTRGPLDIVEVPSHTFERFASDPGTLRLLSRHHATGARLDEAAAAALAGHAKGAGGSSSTGRYGPAGQQYAALEVQQQLVYCLVDQAVHGPPPHSGSPAQRALGDIVQRHSSFGYADGTWPHLRFSHIVGYGATYYSYLYAEAIASRLWERHLARDPGSRQAGQLLRRGMLEPGGALQAEAAVRALFPRDGGALVRAAGGWRPDAGAWLRRLGLQGAAAACRRSAAD